MPDHGSRRRYWRKNLTQIAVLLAIWFTVSFGFAIFLAEPLGALRRVVAGRLGVVKPRERG